MEHPFDMTRVTLEAAIDELTSCTSCKQTVDNPRSLPCFHTFCTNCLQVVFAKNRPDQVVLCPVCKQFCRIPVGGVSEFPSNFIVTHLLTQVAPLVSRLPSCEHLKGHLQCVDAALFSELLDAVADAKTMAVGFGDVFDAYADSLQQPPSDAGPDELRRVGQGFDDIETVFRDGLSNVKRVIERFCSAAEVAEKETAESRDRPFIRFNAGDVLDKSKDEVDNRMKNLMVEFLGGGETVSAIEHHARHDGAATQQSAAASTEHLKLTVVTPADDENKSKAENADDMAVDID